MGVIYEGVNRREKRGDHTALDPNHSCKKQTVGVIYEGANRREKRGDHTALDPNHSCNNHTYSEWGVDVRRGENTGGGILWRVGVYACLRHVVQEGCG